MKKFLFVFISCITLGTAKTYAQSVDSLQVVVDSLSAKVIKLEHDLIYLKIKTDINTLNTKIEILSIKVDDLLTSFQMAIRSNRKENMRDVLQESHRLYKRSTELVKKK